MHVKLFDMEIVLDWKYLNIWIFSDIDIGLQMATVFQMSKQKLICTCIFFAISSFAVVEEMGSSPLQIFQMDIKYIFCCYISLYLITV